MEAKTTNQVTDDLNYANNIPSTEKQENVEESGDTEQPTIDPEAIYFEIQESPTTATAVVEQALQASAPPVPGEVSQSPTTNDYSNTIQSPAAINHGYSPQQKPPNNNAAHNIPDTGDGGNVSAPNEPQVQQLPTSRSDFIYLERPPAPYATVGEQALRTSAPPAPGVVSQSPTTNDYSNTIQSPAAINHGYSPQQNPPNINVAHNIPATVGGGNVSAPNEPQVQQLPTSRSDFIYLEGPPAPSATVGEQALQAPAPKDTRVVPQNPTTNEYSNPTQPPAATYHGHLPQQNPPNNATHDNPGTRDRGNVSAPSGPPVYHHPNVATLNQTTDGYINATQAPSFVNHGYVPQQQPPPYDLHAKGNLGFHPGAPVYQQQPWNQLPAPNMSQSVIINAQPQPTSPNVVILSDPQPERNPSQGLATASLVMAIVGIFCCFPSIVCAIVGITFAALSLGSQADLDKARTYANISMVFTVIGWVLGLILFIVIINSA